jgi:hypothetical protein
VEEKYHNEGSPEVSTIKRIIHLEMSRDTEDTARAIFPFKKTATNKIWVQQINVSSVSSNMLSSIEIRARNPGSQWATWNTSKNMGNADYYTRQKNLFFKSGLHRSSLWALFVANVDIDDKVLEYMEEDVIIVRDICTTVLLETVRRYCFLEKKVEMENCILYCIRNNGGNCYKINKAMFDYIKEVTKTNIQCFPMNELCIEIKRFDSKPFKSLVLKKPWGDTVDIKEEEEKDPKQEYEPDNTKEEKIFVNIELKILCKFVDMKPNDVIEY